MVDGEGGFWLMATHPGRRPRLVFRTVVLLVGLFAVGCARRQPAAPVLAARPQKAGPAALYPDAERTPGVANPAVTQENIHQTICRANWTETIRPPARYTNALKRQQMREYADTAPDPRTRCVPRSAKPRCYEEDHFIPLELGGHPMDPRNLWPEPYTPTPGARQKDWVETFLRRQVCDGAMTLQDAQRVIVRDWVAVYQAHHEARRAGV